jgi:hypothetical protein
LPEWAYASSDFSEDEEEKGKAKEKEPKRKAAKEPVGGEPKRRKVTDYEQSILYDEEAEHYTGESARIGMIRGALKQSKKSSPEAEHIESDDEFGKK